MQGGRSSESPPGLIGRERELATLEACLDDAVGGLARVALLRGEAGIGKTRLAEEVSARAVDAQAVVAWGRCWEEGGAPAGWPLLELLRELASAPALASARAELEAASAALAAGHDEADRFVRFDAVARALARAALEAPIVAILDDLHWADDTSLVLLKFLARRSRRARLLLVGTVRDVDAPLTAEAARLLADVAREAVVIELSGLAEDDVAALAARAGAPDGSAGRIVRAAGGNPLFVEELALHLSARGGGASDELPLPDGVRAMLARRLARLPAEVRGLVARAAAIGAEVDVSLLREATVHAGGPWSDADLRAALTHGVLVEAGSCLRFRHDLVRQVALADAVDAARDHRAIARALEARGGEPAEIARHLFACSDPRAIDVAVEASRRATARLAYDQSTALLERALEATQARGEVLTIEVAELRLALGEALLRAGHSARGARSCLAAAELARRLDQPRVLARAALAYGAVVRHGQVDPDLVLLLQSALAALQDDLGLRATLSARLAGAMQPSQTPEVPLALARESIGAARELGDQAVLARVLDAARPAFRPLDDVDERIAIDRETMQVAAKLGDHALSLRAEQRLSVALLQRGDVAGAVAHLDLVERAATDRAQPSVLFQVAQARLVHHLLAGRFDQADAQLHIAAGQLARVPDPLLSSSSRLPMFGLMLLHARGRLADTPSLATIETAAPPPVRDLLLAASFAQIGALDQARAAVERLFARGDHLRLNYQARLLLPGVLAELDDGPRAALMLPLMAALAGTCAVQPDLGLCEGAAARLTGMLLTLLGQFDDALAAFAQARAMNQAMGAAPFVHATDLAEAEARLRRRSPGDAAAARALLERAAIGFESLAMTARVARVRRRLEALGSSLPAIAAPPRASIERLAALRREGEVWAIDHAGATVHLKDAHGLRYLAHLVMRPAVEVHVGDLSAAIRDAAEVADMGDAGPMLDAEAKASYRRRLADLREMVEEATLLGDAGRAERGRTEIEFLATELSRAFGLGGRERRAASDTERQRVNVTLRIRKAIKKIAAACPALGDHLDRAIATGTFCSYDPPPGPRVTA